MQYLSPDEQRALVQALETAGRRSTPAGPLGWLRMEPPDWRRQTGHQVVLTTWPEGGERLLARAGPHGLPVRWMA